MKPSYSQYCAMLDYLEDRPQMLTGKLDRTYTVKDRKNDWQALRKILDSMGDGAKKTFQDWRGRVRGKYRNMKSAQRATGGGPHPKPLTQLEERLMAMIGSVSATGLEGVEEAGISEASPEVPQDLSVTPDIIEPPNENEVLADMPDPLPSPSSPQPGCSTQETPIIRGIKRPREATSRTGKKRPAADGVAEAAQSIAESQAAIAKGLTYIGDALMAIAQAIEKSKK